MVNTVQKKRILILTSTFPRYAGDSTPDFVYQLARRLTNTFEVYVLCPFAKGTKKYELLEDMHVFRYSYMPFSWENLAYDGGIVPKLRKNWRNFFQVPSFLFCQWYALSKLVKQQQITIVHAHWIIPQGWLAAFYKRFFQPSIKLLVTVHGSDIFALRGNFFNRLRSFVYQQGDAICAVSTNIHKAMVAEGCCKNIYVYPMGVDTSLFQPQGAKVAFNSPGYVLLFVGRLIKVKGVEDIIQAMPKILEQFADTHLKIIGDGPEKTSLEELVQKLDLAERIEFLGAIPNKELPAYYRAAHVLIGPSIKTKKGDNEGFGLVLAEAMSCGIPVITTKYPADLVIDGKTGIVVEEGSPQQISKAVNHLLTNQEVANTIQNQAQKHIMDNFSWNIMAQKYLDLAQKL